MIDIDKVRRFEDVLEKNNNSVVVAKIWNELEHQFVANERYISELEETISYFQFVDYKRTQFELLKSSLEIQLLINEIERITGWQ